MSKNHAADLRQNQERSVIGFNPLGRWNSTTGSFAGVRQTGALDSQLAKDTLLVVINRALAFFLQYTGFPIFPLPL